LPARIECMAKYVTVGRSIFVSCAVQAADSMEQNRRGLGLPWKCLRAWPPAVRVAWIR
jgi:hypothetical protein